MSDLLHAAQRRVAARIGARSHTTAHNEMRIIGGQVVTVADICARSGYTLRKIGDLYRAGHREWADYGVVDAPRT